MSEEPNAGKKLLGWVDTILEKTKPKPRKKEPRHYGTIQDRMVAGVIDMGILFIMFFEVLTASSHFIESKVRASRDVQPQVESWYDNAQDADKERLAEAISIQFEIWVLQNVVTACIFGIILILVWQRFHTSPGKWLFGLRMAGDDGESWPEPMQYVKRYLGYLLSMPIFLIGFLLGAFHPKKQAWHDRIAKTTVIYTEEGHIFKRAWTMFKHYRNKGS